METETPPSVYPYDTELEEQFKRADFIHVIIEPPLPPYRRYRIIVHDGSRLITVTKTVDEHLDLQAYNPVTKTLDVDQRAYALLWNALDALSKGAVIRASHD